ncbi:hypothetical protein [Roseimaritima multifibrata]|uniref:hypothetical protein n=1 Tax=Roseimaritima multifibrata TaxID=1930274 RepID=UPI0011A60E38|nr:hypothetical protein [Roseimaritima multifibrata]
MKKISEFSLEISDLDGSADDFRNAGQRSTCETAKLNQPVARFFLNPGQPPQPGDDLVALGVTAMEMRLGASKCPSTEKLFGQEYRNALLQKFGRRFLASPEDRLIRTLVSITDPSIAAGDLLGSHVRHVRLTRDGGIKLMSNISFARHSKLAVFAMVALGGLMYWFLTTRENRVRSEYERAKVEHQLSKSDLGSKIDDARTELASIKERLAAREEQGDPIEERFPNKFQNDPRYLTFKDEPVFASSSFVELLDRNDHSRAEKDKIEKCLKELGDAWRVWKGLIIGAKLQSDLEIEISGETDVQVEKILRAWIKTVNRGGRYPIRLVSARYPKNLVGYPLRLTLTNQANSDAIEWKAGANGKFGEPSQVDFKWKLGEPVEVCLESFSNWNWNWNNKHVSQYDGALSLLKTELAPETEGPFRIQFEIENPPGPPLKLVSSQVEPIEPNGPQGSDSIPKPKPEGGPIDLPFDPLSEFN